MSNNGHADAETTFPASKDVFPYVLRSKLEASQCIHLRVLCPVRVMPQRDSDGLSIVGGAAVAVQVGALTKVCVNPKMLEVAVLSLNEAQRRAVMNGRQPLPTDLEICQMCTLHEAEQSANVV